MVIFVVNLIGVAICDTCACKHIILPSTGTSHSSLYIQLVHFAILSPAVCFRKEVYGLGLILPLLLLLFCFIIYLCNCYITQANEVYNNIYYDVGNVLDRARAPVHQ